MNRIEDICYAEEVYDCEFSDNGVLLDAHLRIAHLTGFKVDSISVMAYLTDHAIEKFERVWAEHKDLKILERAERAADEWSITGSDPKGAA